MYSRCIPRTLPHSTNQTTHCWTLPHLINQAVLRATVRNVFFSLHVLTKPRVQVLEALHAASGPG